MAALTKKIEHGGRKVTDARLAQKAAGTENARLREAAATEEADETVHKWQVAEWTRQLDAFQEQVGAVQKQQGVLQLQWATSKEEKEDMQGEPDATGRIRRMAQ